MNRPSMSHRSSVSSSIAGAPTALRNDAILYLTILSARDLKKVQTLGEQDPYCSVYIATGGKEQEKAAFKTDTHDNGGTQPIWNAKGHILIPDISADAVRFRIKNNNWGKNTIIGEIVLAMRDLSRGRSMEKEFALAPQGFLKVLMYLSLGHENPTSQPRVKFGEYPQHFIPGKTKLYLGLITGSKLRNIQAFGTQDPYCEVYLARNRLPSSKDLIYKTKTHDNGGKNPRWIEGITVTMRCIEHDFLVIRVMNDNTMIDSLIGELFLKLEMLIGRQFEDRSYPIETDDTIVGQVRLQLALFNDEIMDEDEIRDCDVDGCSCASTYPVRATKVGNVLIDGISPDGVQYLEAGTAVHTGCELAGNYVVDKDVYECDAWGVDELDIRDLDALGSDEWEGDEFYESGTSIMPGYGPRIVAVTTAALAALRTQGFLLPGVQMTTYSKGEVLPIFVNSLKSTETLLPLDYYKLPFCQPEKIEYKSENLGEYLTANRIQNSPYEIKFLEEQTCAVLCKQEYTDPEVQTWDDKIKASYRVNWILDNLPATSVSSEGGLTVGFPLGSFHPDVEVVPQLNNHVKILIGYNNHPLGTNADGSKEKGRIVDFHVIPSSFEYADKSYDKIKNRMDSCAHSSDLKQPLYVRKNKDGYMVVYWTYSIEWVLDNDHDWRTRWDVYFDAGSGGDEVHWFSIVNALVIVLFLSGMVGMILMRSLHRDINRYNRVPTEEERAEEREESGWKLVHADVFRPPTKQPLLFCVVIGTGCQLLGMAFVTLFFAALGVLAPSNRGKLVIALLVCFVLLGTLAGYTSARMYKMFQGKRWQLCTILTAVLFPGSLFALFFVLNLFTWGAGSDAAVPFGSIGVVFFLWTGISVPLVFFGAYYGFRYEPHAFPVATSNIPRPIPSQPWYMTHVAAALVGGILPFGAIFVELFFVLSALWTDKYYYVFGFLLLAFLILIHTCAEITIVLTYFQLCSEDYKWWWRSFFVSGACGVYVFLYSTYYFWTCLDVTNFIGAMLYFGYMAIISGALALLTGAVGVGASLWFTRKIYASIKVD